MTTALAVTRLGAQDAIGFEFGDVLDPERSTKERIWRILEEFDHRWDEVGLLPTTARETLLEILANLDDGSKLLAPVLAAIGWFPEPRGWERVAERLEHPDRAVKLAALRCLGRMSKRSAEVIQPFLQSSDLQLRKAAIVQLGKFGQEEPLPKMTAAAAGEAELEAVLAQARERIDATRNRDVGRFVDVVLRSEEYLDLVLAGAASSKRMSRKLGRVLVDPQLDPATTVHAVEVLGLLEFIGAAQHFLDFLSDPENTGKLRVASAAGLGRCRIESAVDLLLSVLGAADSELQAAAITSLGQIGSPAAVGPLLQLWDQDGVSLRSRMRLALRRACRSPDSGSLTLLLETDDANSVGEVVLIDEHLELHRRSLAALLAPHIRSASPASRRNACFLLGFCGTQESSDRLVELASNDDDPDVRRIAELAHRRLASGG